MGEARLTIGGALRMGAAALAEAGLADAVSEAGVVLSCAAGISRAAVLAHPEQVLSAGQEERWRTYLSRRAGREPMAYIAGEQEFMGLSFAVSRDVLIPRADTETLVEEAMRHLHDGMRFLDLCTGSGCIALSLLHYSNGTSAVATDLSGKALAVAQKNAEALGLSERAAFVRADLWPEESVEKRTESDGEAASDDASDRVRRSRFDLIVANPPYIAAAVIDTLQPEVRAHEPRVALDGGADGLDFYRRIVAGAPNWLYSDGWLLVEVGFDQGESVRSLFEGAGFHNVEVIRDFGGQNRVIKGCYYV